MSQEAQCSCPAKIMLAGEYAVVEGGPAVLLAVNRRAVARVTSEAQALSPFLRAAHQVLAQRFGEDSNQAQAMLRMSVDTSAFQQAGTKLGLGSSAAATVAAMGAALGPQANDPSNEVLLALAMQAHGDAQALQGARGSGADIATCVMGGCLRFQNTEAGPQRVAVTLPADLHLVFPWTGVSASTGPLVQRVSRWRSDNPQGYGEHKAELSEAAESLAQATDATKAIAAIARGGAAVAKLGDAAGAALWLPVHTQLAQIATSHQGALKPTGAGAGDLALAAFPSAALAQSFCSVLASQGIFSPKLAVDPRGVHLQA